LKPNARLHLLPEAAARNEQRLEAVRCKPWFGGIVVGRRPIAEASDLVLARCAKLVGAT
jgi:hypothetical protein